MEQQVRELIPHPEDDVGRLQVLIDGARARLAKSQAALTVVRQEVRRIRSAIFERLAPQSRVRDELRVLVRFRADLLAGLRTKDEVKQTAARTTFTAENEAVKSGYRRATQEATQVREVPKANQEELSELWRKLVKLHHPDKLDKDPAKQATYHKLIAAINHARDTGDLRTLQEIAADPETYVRTKGWGSLESESERRSEDLRRLLASLEEEITKVDHALEQLHESSEYQLSVLIKSDSAQLDQFARRQAAQIETEIMVLEEQAKSLKAEIEKLTGKPLSEE